MGVALVTKAGGFLAAALLTGLLLPRTEQEGEWKFAGRSKFDHVSDKGFSNLFETSFPVPVEIGERDYSLSSGPCDGSCG